MKGPGDILPHSAAKFAGKTALICQGRSFSFLELDQLSDQFAMYLLSQGIFPGDTVSLLSQNRWEWVVCYHGALKAGAVVNPINVMLTPSELKYVLSDCKSVALCGGAAQIDKVTDVRSELSLLGLLIDFDNSCPEATFFRDTLASEEQRTAVLIDPSSASTIGYTSGTTGHPKGAVQSHRAVLHNCICTALMHQKTSEDVVVSALPAAHVYGNVVVNGTWLAGGTIILMERFDPAEALRLIAAHRATIFEGVPAMYAAMLSVEGLDGYDLSSLTRCTVGGQTIAPAVVEKWENVAGCPLIELWGMTEISGLGATVLPFSDHPKGSIGVALPGVEIRIADIDNPAEDAPNGVAGELMVRGPIVMIEYFGNADASGEAIDRNGWLHSGDIAVKDDSGHLFIVDRLKDLIITGGYNVYPAEIERVLAGHPAVAMVAVGAIPDPIKGELACAYIVRAEGVEVSEDDILKYSEADLAPYKRPRMIKFVSSLPTTSSGKVMRRSLSHI